ncbi:glycosyl transferase family 1 [Gemmiger sp. An120]|uniref:glycosyltransferase family 1 protein n=1 Tax=Gemmiger sp. An120 TaxID=1965549 RepID=UPI000B36998E|nr:glycosyltransferase family 1 protein [Gemmiger sp. An120]OUQ43271.1 glycosyl transferase family 1 [Gemmiger sp. An120]
MLRILQCVNQMNRAGLETMLMNYYRQMDRSRVQFDFLTHRPEEGHYDAEIAALGGRVYHAPRLYPQNYPAYFRSMAEFYRQHLEYKIVHSHIDAMSYLPLLAAKGAGVPVRIAHSHSAGIDRDMKYPLKLLFRRQLHTVTTLELACGETAGRFLFRGRPFEVVANAIDTSRYRFDTQLRQETRRQLNISAHTFVVGHVGRFYYPKNQPFLIRAFAQLHERLPDSLLLLAGAGELQQQAKDTAVQLGLGESVRFLGVRDDVPALMQAMDLFAMPSLFEGLPMVGLEAQAADLPVLFSANVPRDVCISEKCAFLALENGETAWAQAMERTAKAPGERAAREMGVHDIRRAAPLLQQRYEELFASIKDGA